MSELDSFIRQGHQKVIDHYRRLRDTAHSEVERERFQQRMAEEYEALMRDSEHQQHGTQRAA